MAWMAEEVLQDSFLKVWIRRRELPHLNNFGGWLYTLSGRLAINALQDFKRKKSCCMNIQKRIGKHHP